MVTNTFDRKIRAISAATCVGQCSSVVSLSVLVRVMQGGYPRRVSGVDCSGLQGTCLIPGAHSRDPVVGIGEHFRTVFPGRSNLAATCSWAKIVSCSCSKSDTHACAAAILGRPEAWGSRMVK